MKPRRGTGAGRGPDAGASDGADGWLAGSGEAGDVVLSSRARLARNIAGFRFPNRASPAERTAMVGRLKPVVLSAGFAPQVEWVDLSSTSSMHRGALVEEHLISRQHAMGKPGESMHGRAVAIGLPERRLSVMINEEDHLRLQVMRSGLDLAAALEEIDALDDRIEARVDYAFDPRFGYLTACPTNIGTGARLSVMLHLPALRMTREIEKVKRAADDLGLTVRGAHGEGSEASGDFYQLSNQTTIGKSEAVLLKELEAEIVPSVIAYERTARQRLVKGGRRGLEDQAWRAVGVLLHARLLAADEAMQLLSRLRLGIAVGIVPQVSMALVNRLIIACQPSHLQLAVAQELTQEQRREARAALLRARLGAAFAAGPPMPRRGLIRPGDEPPASDPPASEPDQAGDPDAPGPAGSG
ncbi:MAG: protein arginine kinase [Planctomycetota bacterium]